MNRRVLPLPKTRTPKMQRDVSNTVDDFQNIIHQSDRWKYVNLKPTAPTIRGPVKFHKEGAPIRPIIRWKNAPVYKLTKILVKKIHT
jgi:hypothetical protein